MVKKKILILKRVDGQQIDQKADGIIKQRNAVANDSSEQTEGSLIDKAEDRVEKLYRVLQGRLVAQKRLPCKDTLPDFTCRGLSL